MTWARFRTRAGDLRAGATRVRRGWWAAIRAAGALRLTYEIALASLLAGSSAVTAAVSATPTVVSIAGVVLAVLVLSPLRLVYPAGALVAGAAVGASVGEASTYLIVVLSAAAGFRAQGPGRTVLAFLMAWVGWLGWLWRYEDLRDAEGVILASAAFVLVSIVPGAVGAVVGRRRRLVRAMHWRNVQLHDQHAVVARQARARERTRIARDLHDSLGHQLTLISLYAGTLPTAPSRQREETVSLLRSAAAAAMSDLRHSIGVLREYENVDDVGVVQPLTDLESLADAVRSTGAPFTLDRSGVPFPLPSFIEHAAYRVIQEGVTNALRHARGAWVEVTLRYEPDALVAEVVNGMGAQHGTDSGGQGLIGLEERLRLAGGVLYHGPTPAGGFRLAAMLPYRVADPAVLDDSQTLPVGSPVPEGKGDFAEVMRRSARRSRLGLIVLSAGGVAVVAVCCVAMIVVAAAPRTTVRQEEYDAAEIGQSELDVMRMLPDASAAETDAVGGGAPPRDAACLTYRASLLTEIERDTDRTLVYRFCFRDGILISKKAFEDLSAD